MPFSWMYVIVIDGNMKNRRDVCLAKHAGKIQYTGLPGYVMTGCMQTPASNPGTARTMLNESVSKAREIAVEVCSKLYVMLENVTSHACTDDEGSEFVGETLLEITRQQTLQGTLQ